MKKIFLAAVAALVVAGLVFVACKKEENNKVEKEIMHKSNDFVLITATELQSMNPLDWEAFLQNDPEGTLELTLITLNSYFIMHTTEDDSVFHFIMGKDSTVSNPWRDRLSGYFDAIDPDDFPFTDDFQDGDELPLNAIIVTRDIRVVKAVLEMCKKEKRDCVVTYNASTGVYKIIYEDK